MPDREALLAKRAEHRVRAGDPNAAYAFSVIANLESLKGLVVASASKQSLRCASPFSIVGTNSQEGRDVAGLAEITFFLWGPFAARADGLLSSGSTGV